jgi:hypothetical protein
LRSYGLQRDHGSQAPAFFVDIHPEVRDASTDERPPRDAMRLTGSLVHVEDYPVFGVVDQYRVVDEFAKVAVFF